MNRVLKEKITRLEEIVLDIVAKTVWESLTDENKKALPLPIEVGDMNTVQQAAYDKAIKQLGEEIQKVSVHLLDLINENVGLNIYALQLYTEFGGHVIPHNWKT